MEERGEANLGVDHSVLLELFEEVFGDEMEGVFGLHELEAAGGAGEEVGEAGALLGRDEFVVVFFARDGGVEAGDGLVA